MVFDCEFQLIENSSPENLWALMFVAMLEKVLLEEGSTQFLDSTPPACCLTLMILLIDWQPLMLTTLKQFTPTQLLLALVTQ